MQTPDPTPPSFPQPQQEPVIPDSTPFSTPTGLGSAPPPPPAGYSGSSAPPPPPTKKTNLVPILVGCGCGLPILVIVGLIILGAIVQKSGYKSSTTNTITTSTTYTSADYNLEKFVGEWRTGDDTEANDDDISITIKEEKGGGYSADYHADGQNDISGGDITLDSKSKMLSVQLQDEGHTWKIDAPPHKYQGDTLMTLGGHVFKQTKGTGDADVSTGENANFDSSAPPSSGDQASLASETLGKFSEALKSNDFTGFHSYISSDWQSKSSPEDLRGMYKNLLGQKAIDGALSLSPSFSPEASLDNEGCLVLQGFYPTQPLSLFFKFTYEVEGAQWKLKAAEISPGSAIG